MAFSKEVNDPVRSAIMTIMSASASVVAQPLLNMFISAINKEDHTMRYDLISTLGCLMAGCVSVTASCNNIEMHSAIVIGVIGSLCYQVSVILFDRFQIDDPIQATQVHAICGFWGLCAEGIFDKTHGLIATGDLKHFGV